jgi:hypothetical protein
MAYSRRHYRLTQKDLKNLGIDFVDLKKKMDNIYSSRLAP